MHINSESKGEERKRKRGKKGKNIENKKRGEKEVKKQLKNFAGDTHLKFTKGKRIQLKILAGVKKSNFSKNILL